MDSALCASAAVIETAALVPLPELLTPAALRIWLAFFVAQFTLFKVYRLFIYPVFFSPLRKLPGPKNTNFLLGQAVTILSGTDPNAAYVSWMKRWPDAPFVRYRLFPGTEMLLVNSLAAHKEVLQTSCYSFIRPAFFHRLVGELVGTGLLFSDNDSHRKMRRLLAAPFSLSNIKKLLPLFQRKSRELTASLNEAIDGPHGGIVEVESAFTRAALDIIGVAALGTELDKTATMDFFLECYHGLLAQPRLGQLLMFINPFIPVRWLPLEANRKFERANSGIRNMIGDMAKRRMQELAARASNGAIKEKKVAQADERKDILTFMIESAMASQESFTEKEIIENILQFVAAGHDTTTDALTWAAFVLAGKPEMQGRLREEIMSAVEEGQDPDFNTIESLRYMNNFVKEMLRVYSPTLSHPREALTDLVIDGVTVPKGTIVMVVPAAIHANKKIWGPDAEEFDPERWERLGPTASNPYAWQAFNGGPRMCIGKQFALAEFKVILIELLRNFVLEPVDTTFTYVNPALTLKPAGGMHVRVRRLKERSVAV